MIFKELLQRYKLPVLLISAVCLAAAAILLSGAFGNKKIVSEQPPLVRTATIRMSGAAQAAKYAGEVRGRYESQLAFQVSGKIIRRHYCSAGPVRPVSAQTGGKQPEALSDAVFAGRRQQGRPRAI